MEYALMDQNCSHKPLSGNAWRGILRTVLVSRGTVHGL
jgi:hypothetical protein